jgi:hypothetical protein
MHHTFMSRRCLTIYTRQVTWSILKCLLPKTGCSCMTMPWYIVHCLCSSISPGIVLWCSPGHDYLLISHHVIITSVDECLADGVELKAILKHPTSYYFFTEYSTISWFMQQQPHNHEIISESLLILRFRDCFNNIFMMNIFHICTIPLPWTWYSLKLLSSCMYESSHYAELEWFFMVPFAMVKENRGVSDSITSFLGIWLKLINLVWNCHCTP